jgi:hypothetical protein
MSGRNFGFVSLSDSDATRDELRLAVISLGVIAW